MTTRRVAAVLLGVAVLGLVSCSDSKNDRASKADKGAAQAARAGTPTSTTRPAPSGPTATFSKELTGGNGVFIGEATAPDLKAEGYVQREYAASGTATSYKSAPFTHDGRWTFTPDTSAAYRTRV